MRPAFNTLRVLEARPETSMATTVEFDVPEHLADAYRWRPGQHLTVRLAVDGQEVRRPYSISQSPTCGEPMSITVKRVKDGLVSNHINDRLGAGDSVDVMTPFGGFCLDPAPTARRTYYFFGAGSGITPLYAMIRSVLDAEPHSVAHLAYGNVNADTIIFRQRLADLEAAHRGRLHVRHVLSDPERRSSFRYWRRGWIDAEAVRDFIDEHRPYAQDARYYICGPGTMNSVVRAALTSLDVPSDRIYLESYGGEIEQDTSFAGVAAQVRVRLGGEDLRVPVAAGQTILDAVRAAGGSPRYSCESGVCGACRAELRDGQVHMRACMALTESEIERGAILTCQSVAKTATALIDYDR